MSNIGACCYPIPTPFTENDKAWIKNVSNRCPPTPKNSVQCTPPPLPSPLIPSLIYLMTYWEKIYICPDPKTFSELLTLTSFCLFGCLVQFFRVRRVGHVFARFSRGVLGNGRLYHFLFHLLLARVIFLALLVCHMQKEGGRVIIMQLDFTVLC